MQKISLPKLYSCIAFVCCIGSAAAQTGTSTLVSIGTNGKLKYTPDANGNIIPDFSTVGYKNSDESIPDVPVVKTITAVSGDNTSNIQNAINAVAALTPDANGIRGALLLKAGTYNINTTLKISAGGIIIRGEGKSTILMATATTQYDLFKISGSGGPVNSSTMSQIQGTYIPVGAKTFTLPAGHGFVAGNDVMLRRKPNQAWIHMLGMDVLSQIPCDDGGCNVDWTPEDYTVDYIRKVVSVNGNDVTLDAANVDVIDSKYAQGFIMKYTWTGRIENVGFEDLYFDSKYTDVNDEQHGWNAINYSNVKNCWVDNVEVHHFGYSAVSLNGNANFCTIQNSKNVDPISQTIGGRKYSFNVIGSRNLVQNCSTQGGRHDYVTGAQTAGPNTFVNSTATNQQADIGPHQRWATGILFDQLTSNSQMNAQNRLGYGTGHGWSGSQVLYWNCTTAKFMIQSPPNHMNWAIGCKGTITDVGDEFTGDPCIQSSTGNAIGAIPSLFARQLCERHNDPTCGGTPVITCVPAESSSDDGNVAANVLDKNLTTRWSSLGDGEWIKFCLGRDSIPVKQISIAFYNGDQRVSTFDLDVSHDGTTWTKILTNVKSSGTSTALETFTFPLQFTKYIRLTGHGNTVNLYNSYTEVDIDSAHVAYKNTPHTIPGTIEAEEFDLGKEGIGYHDADTVNSGKAFRNNEGVDIQTTTDVGLGYNISYVTAGEWQNYVVNVTTAGNYNILFRVATTTATTSMHIELDGVNITGSVVLPNTGGWQIWQSVMVNNLALTAGIKEMKIVYETAGINLNYVKFAPNVTTGLDDNNALESSTFTIFPNPAVNNVDIIASVSTDAEISLIDLIGSVVLSEQASATGGQITARLIVSHLAKGVYFVKLNDGKNVRQGRIVIQ